MLNELTAAMEKAIEHMKSQFSSLQAGRASASMVEDLSVESYGSAMPLRSVANISCPDSKTIRIEPWDKNLVSVVEKAVIAADIGIMPQNFGDYLILPVPPMTEERRKKLVKIVHEESEAARIVVRNLRQDTMKKVKSQKDSGEISEDDQKRFEKQIQEKVDDTNKKIDELSKKKESDILTV
ncbi:ribosome recycling factor [bacterium]|jgi:ribosome recycling factor|nr:ribosome recycling factor [bacterium]MBT6831696.1 ribosome recycling factor [bacterium]MBT6996676.1 ribosome recycling factor [bacterium]MBT7772845.1 ribosome recycling factor [bacterium]